MTLARRSLGALIFAAPPALAQGIYPDRPIQMLMPLPAGSGTDVLARVFAGELERVLGSRIIVVNRTGGALTIAMAALASAPADGYTLAFSPVTPLIVQPHRVRLPYARSSVVPVCGTFENVYHVAISPTSRFPNLAALLSHAREHPGALRYGHSGVASAPHIAGAGLWRRAGVDLTHVPYRGEAEYAATLMSGTPDVGIITSYLATSLGLRSLAVIATERIRSHPEVPTVAELGYSTTSVTYGGIFVREGTPVPILARLEAACAEAATSPAYTTMAERQAVQGTHTSRAALTARMEADDATMAALVRDLRLAE